MNNPIVTKRMYKELRDLKKEILFIKEHMFDPDTVMTIQEAKRFERSMKELKKGKTTSLSALKKEIEL